MMTIPLARKSPIDYSNPWAASLSPFPPEAERRVGLRYKHEGRIGGEWRRTWIETDGRTIQDNDLALLLGTDHIALRAGYRWINAGRANLDGPHVGIALAW